VIVLRTLGAAERRRFRGRKPREVEGDDAEAVPTVRATLIRAGSLDDPEDWLERLRKDTEARDAEVEAALRELNAVVRAHRAAAADPYAREVARWQANVVRVGYGSGEQVADGRFSAAYDVPEPRTRVRRADTLAPQERLAAILGGSSGVLVAEELVLRARIDLDAGRVREAALQARVALESLLAALPGHAPDLEALEEQRGPVAQAANVALTRDLDRELAEALHGALARMETSLRRHRLGA
jgi:hypothetical protein